MAAHFPRHPRSARLATWPRVTHPAAAETWGSSTGSLRRRALSAAIAASMGIGAGAAIVGAQARTVTEGVYTEAQATRGQAIYAERCASCHGASLGGAQAPPLAGDDFLRAWSGPLSELVNKIQNTMPANDPGKLTRQQSADLVAYLLKIGKFRAGQAELMADEAALKQITFPATATAASTAAAPAFPPAGNMAQLMRGILFPSSNLIFNVQTHDPAAPVTARQAGAGGFNWADWGAGIYTGWELVDYAAVALAESAPLMLTPGRRCENGKLVPVNDPQWIKFSLELAEAGRAAYRASQTRKQEAVSDATDQVATSCSNCHGVYRDKPGGRTRDPVDPSNKAARCVK